MKDIIFVIVAVTSSLFAKVTFAGGFNSAGNGKSIIQTQEIAKANQTRLVEISNAICPRKSRDLRFDGMSRVKVNFDDGKDQQIIPLKLEPVGAPNQSGQQKYSLVFLNDNKNQQLSAQTREIFVDEKWKHENVLTIIWRSATGPSYNVKNFKKQDEFESRDECAIKEQFASNPEIQKIVDSQQSSSVNRKAPAPSDNNAGNR